MSHNQPIPEPFAHLTDLSSDLTGTFVHSATDDYFAEKENLLKPNPPEWREGAYTDRGKWMDGWESQRKRTPGHDHCIMPSRRIDRSILCDTTIQGTHRKSLARDRELPARRHDLAS